MFQERYDAIIVGGGPAGLIAAIESYEPSKKILILEKMHKPALKLNISGKGRCNITNSAEMKDFISHFGKNGRFLKFAFSEFFNTKLLSYFEELGVSFKLERGGRYFPEDDNAFVISKALIDKVRSLNIPIHTGSQVTAIEKLPENIFLVEFNKKILASDKSRERYKIKANKVLLATGGRSYPKTGSSGEGYRVASRLGHTVTDVFPSLVPIKTKGNIAKKLEGLSLRNIRAEVWCKGKKVDERFGEMVFTDFGVSGPAILSLSKTVVRLVDEKQKAYISIDLKPALDHKTLGQRLLREISAHSRQNVKNLLMKLLPRKLVPVFINDLKISQEKRLNQITSEERKRLRMHLKEFRLEVTGYCSFDSAIVTSGGVCIKEIDPRTMESKIVDGLYFAGEIIDIDADTGGFNLQAAFSTGWVAGRAIRDSA